MLDTHESLAAEWHPQLNGSAKAADFSLGSKAKAWWLCKEAKCSPGCTCTQEHVFCAVIQKRAVEGQRCPFCVGQRACACNNLLAVWPQLVQEQWDFAANEALGLSPESLLPGSSKKACRCACSY